MTLYHSHLTAFIIATIIYGIVHKKISPIIVNKITHNQKVFSAIINIKEKSVLRTIFCSFLLIKNRSIKYFNISIENTAIVFLITTIFTIILLVCYLIYDSTCSIWETNSNNANR